MKKIIFLTLIFFLLFTFVSVAKADYTLEIDYPTIGGQQPGNTLTSYIRYIYLFALSIVGIAAFATLVYGGFRYMLSAGNVGSADEAKRIIKGAIFGLILALSAYLILYTINPDLIRLGEPDLPEIDTSNLIPTSGTTSGYQ